MGKASKDTVCCLYRGNSYKHSNISLPEAWNKCSKLINVPYNFEMGRKDYFRSVLSLPLTV